MRQQIVALLALVLSVAVVEDAWGVIQYTVTDLGTLGGTSSVAYSINNSGQVAGYAYINSGTYHVFRTAANQPINPATDDLSIIVGTNGYARGINDQGQVAGRFVSGTATHAFRTAANQPIVAGNDLGTLNGTYSEAAGINSSGQVVGYSSYGTQYHAFRTAANLPINPTTDDLGTLGGTNSWALGINDGGQVVGWSYTSGGPSHAYRHSGTGSLTAADDLGTLGGLDSYAYAINNSGQVVGDSSTTGDHNNGIFHAFRTGLNEPINLADDLGTLDGGKDSRATAINNDGVVVGWSNINGTSATHAFLYTGSGPMQDLNNLVPPGSGWTLQYVDDINDAGQIVGYGVNPDGQTHAFLLTPTPEPSTLALLGISAIGLMGYGWRRRRGVPFQDDASPVT